ncbi:MAG: zinc-dependent metalloprotease, partial [Oligoflexia bacterium]|nr:zinc-dependent metalloprotease [Oligoflexia bacterium]
MYKLFISFLILSLSSCFGNKSANINDGSLNSSNKARKDYIKRNCVRHRFAQGQDDDLYGLKCIEGKQLVIETSENGEPVSTSEITESAKGLKLEGNLNFKNKFYNTSFNIKKGQGNDKAFPFLLNFLPTDEEFTGDLNTKYHIIFKIWGNYLVLFKASKNLNELPYTERTSLKVFRDGKMRDYDSKDKAENEYYAVPFIGYPIKYCKAETITNRKGEKTFESRANCEESHLQNAEYIQVKPDNKQSYEYLTTLKKDLFPAEYFEGLWYFSEGDIETASREGELAPFNARLIKMEKERDSFNLKDMSGDVEERNRGYLGHLPVKRRAFETNQKGNNQFITFGEREKDDIDYINRPYTQIDFVKMGIDLISLTITPDYLSYIQKVTVKDKAIKRKVSYLRARAVDTAGFVPKKWFLNDHKHVFGILWSNPQDEGKRAEVTESERLDHLRMIRFNTSLNTDEEKKTKAKTIKWHFSKNSTTDPEYREIAQKAVDIYNQAFEYLTKDSDKKIQIQLVKEHGKYIEKDLGDLRYNIINLVKTKDLSSRGSGILGVAPSYVNPDTGQIIGTTANMIVHTQEEIFDKTVRDYIRYEIFQKDKRADKDHVVSPYLRDQIQKKCPEVDSFIKLIKGAHSQLRPRRELSDKQTIISCGKELTKQALLGLILHEMGHSFGLAHNFKASVDSENYYQSEEEIKAVFPYIDSIEKIAHSSSVMDYTKFDHPEMTFLGKYDLAALRYLYLDEIETIEKNTVGKKEVSLKNLNIDPDPKQQKALTENILQNRKNYLHCSDELKIKEPLCYPHDYGGNPKEIAEDDILSLRRELNRARYRYDLDENLFKTIRYAYVYPNDNTSHKLGFIIATLLARTFFLYNRWLQLRNNYLESLHQLDNTSYILNDQDSIDEYTALIKNGQNSKEYALYYPIREKLSEIVMELMDLEEMSCHVKDSKGKEQVLILEAIKNLLKYDYGNDLYVEDCHSPQVLDFFNKSSLTFIKQSGYENFISYYPQTSPQSKRDMIPISDMLLTLPVDPFRGFYYDPSLFSFIHG